MSRSSRRRKSDDKHGKDNGPFVLKCANIKEIPVVQTSPNSLSIRGFSTQTFDFVIHKLRVSGSNILVSSNQRAQILTYTPTNIKTILKVDITGPTIEILGDTIYVANKNVLEVYNKTGEVRVSTKLETDSSVVATVVNGRYLCLLCRSLELFVFDISKRAPSQLYKSKITVDEENYVIKSISISRGGFCFSYSLAIPQGNEMYENVPHVYLHNPKSGSIFKLKPPSPPLEQMWDSTSERLLCIQCEKSICPYLVTDDLKCLDLLPRYIPRDKLMYRVDSPRIMAYSFEENNIHNADSAVISLIIPELAVLDGFDSTSRRILVNLLFHIKNNNKQQVERILRDINEDTQIKSAIPFLISLGERELTENLVKKLPQITEEKPPDNFGFLNSIATKNYDDIELICAPKDSICIKAASYLRGSSQVLNQEYDKACDSFAYAGSNGPEILRIAMQQGDLSVIFKAANEGNTDPQLHLWLGRFYEYKQKYETALTHYDLCGELAESIRVLCMMGKFDEASRRAYDTEQKGAITAYARLLIRKLPTIPKDQETLIDSLKRDVISLFKKANQYGPAFQFAFEQGMMQEALSLSLSAPKTALSKAAMKLESKGDLANAVLLYNRAGRASRALTLCLDNNLLDTLEEISGTIHLGCDPNVLTRCAEFFSQESKWEKAAFFYAIAENFEKTLSILESHNAHLPRSLLDELTQSERLINDSEKSKQIATICEHQGAYIIAAQIWSTIGDHISAMRSIIKDGDSDKVIRYANKLKRMDAFIAAADFIATTNPRDNEPLFATAIQFYQRAGAYDRIAKFLESTAHNEIDEFKDYHKALDLIRKAHQTMAKTEMTLEREAVVEKQLQKIRWIEMYLEATICITSDPVRMQSLCNELLQTPGVETCLRIEDIYILLVQYFVYNKNFSQAYTILDNLKRNGVDLKWFMDTNVIQNIYRAAGQEYVEREDEKVKETQVKEIPDDVADAFEDDF